ncbi:MAG TPA: flagellar basal body-associated FliL family protein [Solirubrobacteraceae bacterium]|nr:flagellar basal body-associated FliL family protein [Solirubrobacteraceae bacterium]
MTKKKLIIIVSVALVAVVGGYKLGFAKEAKPAEAKIHGDVYVLGKDFLVNLADGHYAKLGIAIVVDHGAAVPAGGGGHGAAAPKPPEGYGPLPQEAAVRDIVTDTLTDVDQGELTERAGREELKERILKRIKQGTDVPIHEVLFTDVSVQ